MTGDEYREAIDRLGLTHSKAARLFGVGVRSSRRWRQIGVSGPVEKLLQLMLSGQITIGDLAANNKSRDELRP